MGYVAIRPTTMGGFWGSLVGGSLKLFKTAVPIAATAATGGTAGVAMAAVQGAGALASEVKGAGSKQQQTAVQPTAAGNILTTLPNSTLAVGGLAGLALIVALAKR